MTFGEIIEEVVMDLDEEMTDDEVVNKVKRYINRAYKDLALKEGLEKVTNKIIIDGKLSVPSDCIKVNSLIQDGTYLPFRKDGKYIYTLVDGNCEFNYIFKPEPLESLDDEPLTNEGNIEYLLNFAKWQFSNSEGLTENATYYRNLVQSHKVITPCKITKTIDVLGGFNWN